jgi:hypothetical protein
LKRKETAAVERGNAKRTPKPKNNPHKPGTDLSRGFDEGWRKARREQEVVEDRILEDLGSVGEVLDGLRNRYQVRIAHCARNESA